MKKIFNLIVLGLLFSSLAEAAVSEDSAKRISSFASGLAVQKSFNMGKPEYIELINGYARWLVVAESPPKHLNSGYCVIKKTDLYVGEKSGVIELENKIETKLITTISYSICPTDQSKYFIADNSFSERESIKYLKFISNVIASANEGKCYGQYLCKENVVPTLKFLSISNLIEIGFEHNSITFRFLSKNDREANLVASFMFLVNAKDKIIDMSVGDFEAMR